MKLISLTIRNFMPYKGDQEIAFPVHGQRNVVVIHGDNMRGKTSLLNAIRWALYGQALDRHLNPIPENLLLNKDAAKEGDFDVEVKLQLEHEGAQYEIVRTLKRKPLVHNPTDKDHFTHERMIRRTGAPVPDEQFEHEVNRILPRSVARFSLFDGELLQEYEKLVAEASAEESHKIKEAIEMALGVPTLINGRDHLRLLLQRAQNQFRREGEKDSQHAKLIQETVEDLEHATAECDKLDRLFKGSTAERDTLAEELSQVERAESVKAKIEENRSQQRGVTDARNRASARRAELSSEAWRALIATGVARRKQELEGQLVREQTRIEDEVQQRVERQLKMVSLRSGVCALCGDKMTDNARHALEHGGITESLSTSATTSLMDSGVASAVQQLGKLRALHDDGVGDEIVQAERELDRAAIEINRLKLRERDLLSQIPGVDLADIGRKRDRLSLLQKEVGRTEGLLAAQQNRLALVQKKYDALIAAAASGQNASSQLTSRRVKLLSTLHEVFEKSIERLRSKLRERVESAATETFKRLTTEKQYLGLKINERYGLQILDHLGRTVSVRSAGAEQIVALSLIDGLAHASGSPGLLVMDTPFGRLDLKHRENVLSYLPTMARQVVLLVHEGELNRKTDMPMIANKVSASYEIKHRTPTQSQLVETHGGEARV